MNTRILLLIVTVNLAVGLVGCSDEDQSAKKDHVFKEKTATIDQAKEVENLLKDAAKKQQAATE